jgi:O-antigen/teichoic acid export membrane protein
MGVAIRQSILTSVISYIGVAIGYINLLYLYPKFLEPEQIGLLRTIQDAALLFTPFAIFGLGQSIIKFFPHFSAEDERSANFITLILTLGLLCYGVFLIAFMIFQDFFISFFEKNAPNIIQYVPLILWLTFFLLFITLLEQYSRSLLKIAFPSFLREVGIRLLQGILVTCYFIGWMSFQQFLLVSVILYLVLLVVLALFLIQQRQLKINFNFRFIPRPKLKEIFTFSVLSFVGTSAMILIGKMDSVMVSGMLGLASNAIYTTAFYMATVIEIPKRAITTTASPLIARAFESNDILQVGSIYRKTSINQLIIGSLLLIGIWANLPNLFRLMPRGEYYQAGAFVVTIVGCGKLLDMVFGPSSEIIGLSRHYWFNLVVITLLAGIVIVANAILIPRMGLQGAAFGTVIALTIYNLSKFVFVYIKLGLQPFSIHTLKVLAIAAGTALLNQVLPSLELPLFDILYRSFIITLFFSTLILASKSSEEVNSVFITVLNKLKKWTGRA